MEKTKTFMKKSYETLNMTPLGVEPAEDILLAGSIAAKSSMVTVHPYEEGFAGMDGAIGPDDGTGRAYSDITF